MDIRLKRKVYVLVLGAVVANLSVAKVFNQSNGPAKSFAGKPKPAKRSQLKTLQNCPECQQANSMRVPFPVNPQDTQNFVDINKMIGKNLYNTLGSAKGASSFVYGNSTSMPRPQDYVAPDQRAALGRQLYSPYSALANGAGYQVGTIAPAESNGFPTFNGDPQSAARILAGDTPTVFTNGFGFGASLPVANGYNAAAASPRIVYPSNLPPVGPAPQQMPMLQMPQVQLQMPAAPQFNLSPSMPQQQLNFPSSFNGAAGGGGGWFSPVGGGWI